MRKFYPVKKPILTIFMILASLTAMSQSPYLISYQAVVRDVSNQPLTNTAVTVIFTIHSGTAGGSVVYTETHTPTTNDLGLINLQIGAGTTSDNLALIDWSATSYFLNTNINGNDMGTTQIISVPYSFYSDKAGNVFSGNYNDLSNQPDLSGYLTSESDPQFSLSASSGITSSNIANWNTAYGWGNHASAGYITSETDPQFAAAPAAGISATNVSNWNTAYGWGNHASAGYITSETDPQFAAAPAAGISATNVSNWNTAYGWGNHASAGYITSETDPQFAATPAAGISATNVSNWNTAYGWGNHASAGYITNYQDLSISNNILSLSNSSPTVDLSAYLDSFWSKPGDSLYYTGGNVGIGTQDPRSTLSVVGTTPNDTAIFEVKNNNGQTVFAVYNNGVKIVIDETAKGPKGGFAIGGFNGAKGVIDYLNVSRDSIRMYIDNSSIAKGPKGGFAIGGFDAAKASRTNYMTVTGQESASEGYNTYIGYEAGGDGGGQHNTALGYYSAHNITSGHNNISIGDSAGYTLTYGYENIFIGSSAGKQSSGGYNNVMIGYHAGSDGWNQYNTFVGFEAGRMNNNGFSNVFLGDRAGRGVVSGYRNTLIGTIAGKNLGSGNNNTMVGNAAGSNSANSSNNTFVGNSAGSSNVSGNSNVYVGNYTGYYNGGSNNVFIGNSVGMYSTITNENYRLMIDYSANSDPNAAFITGIMAGAKKLRFNASTSINSEPQSGYALTVSGNAIATTWATTSDARLKTNISEISNALERIMALEGVEFEWKDKGLSSNEKQIGFIAQQVKDVVPEVVISTGEYYSIEYGQLTAILVEAFKELKKENDELKLKVSKINELEQEINELKSIIKK